MNSQTRFQEAGQPSQDEIALRAHQIWLEEGCPQGHDVDNWMTAQAQLMEEYENSRRDPLTRDPNSQDRVASGSKGKGNLPTAGLAPEQEDVPYSAFKDDAPLATKVAEQIVDPSGPTSRRSKTSLEVDTP